MFYSDGKILIAGGIMSIFKTPHGVGSPNHKLQRVKMVKINEKHPHPLLFEESLIVLTNQYFVNLQVPFVFNDVVH